MQYEFYEFFSDLMKKDITIVTQGQGKNLLLKFDIPKGKRPSGPHTGWSLLLQNCHWRVDTQTHSYGSEDSREPLTQLDLGRLETVMLTDPGRDVDLIFSNSIKLHVFCCTNDPTVEQWEITSPVKGNIKVWGNGHAVLSTTQPQPTIQ